MIISTTDKIFMSLVVLLLSFMLYVGLYGGWANLDNVKANANTVFAKSGFKAVGYIGYKWGGCGFGKYKGAEVWYILEKGGITYSAALYRWGDEYHMNHLRAIDAIGPDNKGSD